MKEKGMLLFIQKLLDLGLGEWQILRIVDIEKIEENGAQFAYVIDPQTSNRTGKKFERQDNYYIWQITQFEDCYYGNILYPCEGRWLLISYED